MLISSVLILNLNFLLPILYRLSTIQAADRIVVMDGGQVVEVGFLSIYFESLKQSGAHPRETLLKGYHYCPLRLKKPYWELIPHSPIPKHETDITGQ